MQQRFAMIHESSSTPASTASGAPASGAPAAGGALNLEPLTPSIGAEINGVDFRQPISDRLYAQLRAALLKYKLLIFRDQDISPADQVTLARRFGQLATTPMLPCHPQYPELVVLGGDQRVAARENVFHSDHSFRTQPAMGSVLRCLECPAAGGDTIWADMAAAYSRLPEAIRSKIDGMLASHDILPAFAPLLDKDEKAAMRRQFPPVIHPVVRTHPETREKVLFVNEAYTTHMMNFLECHDSRFGSDFKIAEMELLAYLFRQTSTPEFQVRVKWRPHTIAIWDNRATQHYAIQDYFPAVRRMLRATILGDAPY